MENKEKHAPDEGKNEGLEDKLVELTRLDWGNAWMWCHDCGAKLWDFDGYQDKWTPCPYKNPSTRKCKYSE